MMITSEQLQQILTDLPPINHVKGDYYKVVVREYTQVTPHDGQIPCRDGVRYYEFMKRGHHWVLASVPPF
jgi:hypothetical protein